MTATFRHWAPITPIASGAFPGFLQMRLILIYHGAVFNSVSIFMKALSKFFTASAVSLVILGSPVSAFSADHEVRLAIRDHKFEPTEIKVPAQQRIKLHIHNQDPTPEEFESHSLRREKVIPGGGKAVISIGPLKPGRYTFFGEFSPGTANGVLIVE